jgi:hypothetical protein
MFFKGGLPGVTTKVLLSVVLLVSLVVAACAGDNEPRNKAPEVTLGKGQSECLSEFDRTLKLFLRGDLKDQEVRAFYSCLDSVVTTFLANTKGRGSGRDYTPEQIFKFLKDFFFGELEVSQGLRQQIMQIKRLIVGGEIHLITRDELDRVRGLIGVLEKTSVRMNRHTKLLHEAFTSKNAMPIISQAEIEAIVSDIDKSVMSLAEVLDARGQSYSESQLQSLLVEVHRFIYDGKQDAKKWTRFLPVLWDLKRILLGVQKDAGGEEVFAGGQWPDLMKLFSRGATGWLRAYLFVFSGEFGDEASIYHLGKIKESAMAMLKGSLKFHPKSELSFLLFDRLIESLDREFDFPIGITEEGAKDLLRTLVQLGLTPLENRPKDSEPSISAWSANHMRHLETELDVWLADQRAALEFIESGDREQFKRSELGRAAVTLWDLQIDNLGRLQLRWGEDSVAYDLNSLTQINWKKMVVRLVLRTWAKEPNRRDALESVTPKELEAVQLALWPIGEGLDLWKRGEVQLAQRVVREANLFMPRADGGANVNFEEGVEYFAFVMSGLGAKNHLREDVLKHCDLIQLDEETTGFEVECFRENSFPYLNKWFGHAPYLLNYLHQKTASQDADDARWLSFLNYLEETAVKPDETGEVRFYTQGDVMIMWILCQYVETFFSRFDTNTGRSLIWGRLEIDEAYSAYEIYDGYMSELPGLDLLSDADRLALFTYMMRFGDIPILGDGLGGAVRFIWWKLRQNKWQTDADRIRVVKILAALNKAQSQFIFNGPKRPKNRATSSN